MISPAAGHPHSFGWLLAWTCPFQTKLTTASPNILHSTLGRPIPQSCALFVAQPVLLPAQCSLLKNAEVAQQQLNFTSLYWLCCHCAWSWGQNMKKWSPYTWERRWEVQSWKKQDSLSMKIKWPPKDHTPAISPVHLATHYDQKRFFPLPTIVQRNTH